MAQVTVKRGSLLDRFGRTIDYLRLSVVDRCNLRCVYCLPPQGYPFKSLREILTDEEVIRLVSIMAEMGITKVRVTGGEPLVRPGIVRLIKGLNKIDGIEEVSLSTNGTLFSRIAKDLWQAGLRRVNMSLDTLSPDKFKSITRFGALDEVLKGIERALSLGYDPVKLNVVVMRGINDDEIENFAALTKSLPLHVRFIELMPIGDTGFFSQQRWVSLAEIKELCGDICPASLRERPKGWGPASYFKLPKSLGTIGFIGALSCNFCNRCNRLRLTASGRLHPCLASSIGTDLGPAVKGGGKEEEIQRLILQALSIKPERHQMELGLARESFMCALGG